MKVRTQVMEKNKTGRAVIITNGEIKNHSSLYKILTSKYSLSCKDTVIAADGGAENCLKMNLIPDIVIGDMDSIKKDTTRQLGLKSKKIKYISSSPTKDESDTQLAVEYAVNLNAGKIIIIGATGGRIDHSFANLVLLASRDYNNLDIRIIDENSEIFVIKKSTEITGEKGKKISIFSLSPYTYFTCTTGLKYKLKNEKLFFSPVRGLSNEFIENTANINIKRGQLLIVREI